MYIYPYQLHTLCKIQQYASAASSVNVICAFGSLRILQTVRKDVRNQAIKVQVFLLPPKTFSRMFSFASQHAEGPTFEVF